PTQTAVGTAALAGGTATPTQTAVGTAAPTRTAVGTAALPGGTAAPTQTAAGTAALPGGTAAPPDRHSGGLLWQYALFGLILLALGGAVIFVLGRQGGTEEEP
ncbi:MAG: hypothetical protein WBR35_00640, partial [Anaerolineae bacterium]